MHPSPSMTAMGGQDYAVTRSARLASSARCNGFCPQNRSVEHSVRERGQFPLGPSAGAAHPQLPGGRAPDLDGETTR
jgi:hypothetical protein